MNSLFEQAATLQTQGQSFAWVTVLRAQAPTSAKPGDKAIITADGTLSGWIGGGCAQPAVMKTVKLALASGEPQIIRIAPTDETSTRQLADILEFGMSCHSGGTLELLVDPIQTVTPLWVLGDSPVAQSLAALAPALGFAVTLKVDFDESALANGATKPYVKPYVIVATQGRRDLQALKVALNADAACVWMVASARKADVLRESLRGAGCDSAAVAAIVAPAGTPIGARTPAEIALSVLGAVVAKRRAFDLPVRTQAVAVTAPADAVKPVGTPAAIPVTMPVAVAVKSCCGGA